MTRTLVEIEHGTYKGYQAHKRRGIPMCGACSIANATYMENYRANRADVRARNRKDMRVRNEALKRLIARHRAEYFALIAEVRAESL